MTQLESLKIAVSWTTSAMESLPPRQLKKFGRGWQLSERIADLLATSKPDGSKQLIYKERDSITALRTPLSRMVCDVNRRIRVLFVPQWYPSKEEDSLCGVACREHVRAAALYDDVAVLVFTSRLQRWPTLHWEKVNDAGVPTFYATYGLSPIPKTSWFVFHLRLRRALRRVIQEWGRPDVIHTQDAYGYYVIKAVQDFRIPFVMSQHWSAFMERSLDRRAIRRFAWSFAHVKRVLAANKFAARDYQEYGLQAPVIWLPNALDTETFQPPLRSPREPWLLHASGFTAEKRFPNIIQAFARVRSKRPEALLQVAGSGQNMVEMEALAARNLPSGSFHFHGYLSKAQLADLMRRSRGFVLPSDAETFGCVLMEAMACGCPVLTTRIGGIPAVVREGEGLFVEVGNIDQITQGMLTLLDGTHGLDLSRISVETRRRFSHEFVGRILHAEHLGAARGSCDNASS
jgi:glycosyltransferase involved in cell wall biosynthesis